VYISVTLVGEQVFKGPRLLGGLYHLMLKRIAVFIDGGHVRVLARKAGHVYDPDFIERFSRNCAVPDEDILRVLYYDCAPYVGQAKLPVSGNTHSFTG